MNDPAALQKAFADGHTSSVIAETLRGEGSSRILDIGCGRGGLALALQKRGFSVTGVDPSEAAVEAAGQKADGATFLVGRAEALPVEDSSFDAAVFLNSFHHVPVPHMRAALDEAVRATRPLGPIVIVEPLAEGPYHSLLRVIDDETDIRAAAGRAIADGVRDRLFELRGNVVYERRERFRDVDTLIERLSSVDPERRAAATAHRTELARLMEEHGVRQEDGDRVLAQPLRIYLLRTPN